MTFEEALKALKEGKKIRRKDWCEGFFITLTSNKCLVVNGRTSGLFIDDFSEDWWEEYKEDILDEKEKEYLSAVIKPFRDRVTYIKKVDTYFGCNKNCEYIFGKLSNKDTVIDVFTLPWFPKGSMYKGMELGKEYTLEELGL